MLQRDIDDVRYVDVRGFPNYKVGTNGKVLSCYIPRGRGKTSDVWHELKPVMSRSSDKKVYYRVYLTRDRKTYARFVHRLVLEAFSPTDDPRLDCCHNDGNTANNNLTNLRWDTHRGNMADKKRHGTSNIGKRNGLAKLTDATALDILAMYRKGYSQIEIGRTIGVSQATVSQVITGRTWNHVTGLPLRK